MAILGRFIRLALLVKGEYWKYYARSRFKARISSSARIYCIPHIGRNVYIGGKTTILDRVEIGNGARIEGLTILRNVYIGENSQLDVNVTFMGHGEGSVRIGRECYIGSNCIFDYSGIIEIGNFVHFSAGSGIWTHSSAPMCFNMVPLRNSTIESRPIRDVKISDGVYIGGLCTVYPGVIIGRNSIVAPNSAVSKHVEEFTMVGGVPARFIKRLDGSKSKE